MTKNQGRDMEQRQSRWLDESPREVKLEAQGSAQRSLGGGNQGNDEIDDIQLRCTNGHSSCPPLCEEYLQSIVQAQAEFVTNHNLFYAFVVVSQLKKKKGAGSRETQVAFPTTQHKMPPLFPHWSRTSGFTAYLMLPISSANVLLLFTAWLSPLYSPLIFIQFLPITVCYNNFSTLANIQTTEPLCTSSSPNVTQKVRTSFLQAEIYLLSELSGASLDLYRHNILLLCKNNISFPTPTPCFLGSY